MSADLVAVMLAADVGESPRVQPWVDSPYHLVRWLDVLEFSARAFFLSAIALRSIANECLISSTLNDPNEPMFAMFKPLDESVQRKAKNGLRIVEGQFRKIGLQITSETAKETIADLEREPIAQRCNVQWLLDRLQHIESLAKKEMEDKAFFYVPAERAAFFPRRNDPHLFGEPVADAFPSASADITESGICLALSRSTASVFHLMRVLEIGLAVLGNKFGVSLARTNWGPAIDEIIGKIRKMHDDPIWKAMPDWKEQQEFYAGAASHFGILKDAWRNYTMHARGFYTEEQAERIFANVKAFMQKLAERLHE